MITMTEVASMTRGENEVDVGDSFTFRAEIDLPGIAAADKADLNIEVFAINPDLGEIWLL